MDEKKPKRDGLRMFPIGQSAAKLRTGEGSTTIHLWSSGASDWLCEAVDVRYADEDMVWSPTERRSYSVWRQKYITFLKRWINMAQPIDLTGKKFGRLTVLKRARNNKDGRTMWVCLCDCGNERIVSGKCLRNGHTSSCGCLLRDLTSERSLIDHKGERFGRLTVVDRGEDYISPMGEHHVRWICKCDCGNETLVDVCELVTGHTKSCGCWRSDNSKDRMTTHGGRSERLYKVYANMKNRCLNPNSDDYKYYGERGITVCEEWLNNYSAFRDWAYNNGYDPDAKHGDCTIDRIDVDGNYCPENCRWVSMSVQSKNRRNVINKQ